MGIFDSFFNGTELTKDDAQHLSISMALNLYRGGYTIEQFIPKADMLLEEIFKMEFPRRSISIEQSKQILKNVVRIYTEEKEHLESMNKLSIYMNNPIPENEPTEKVVTPEHIRGWFDLFKDQLCENLIVINEINYRNSFDFANFDWLFPDETNQREELPKIVFWYLIIGIPYLISY